MGVAKQNSSGMVRRSAVAGHRAAMTARQARAIYDATSLVATALLSFLCVSLAIGELGATINVLIFLLAGVIWLTGFALRYVASQ